MKSHDKIPTNVDINDEWNNPTSTIDYDKIRIVDDINDNIISELETLESLPVKKGSKEFSSTNNATTFKKPSYPKIQTTNQDEVGLIGNVPDEEIKKATILKLSILRYKDHFPQHMTLYLEKMELSYLDQLSVKELTNFLDEIRTTVNCLNSISLVHTAYYGAVNLVERFAPLVGFNLNGLTQVVRQSPAINNTLTEIHLQNDLIYVKPEIKLFITSLATVQMVLTENDLKRSENVIPISKNDINDEFSDL
jgi:hypothetical protein